MDSWSWSERLVQLPAFSLACLTDLTTVACVFPLLYSLLHTDNDGQHATCWGSSRPARLVLASRPLQSPTSLLSFNTSKTDATNEVFLRKREDNQIRDQRHHDGRQDHRDTTGPHVALERHQA